MNEEIIEKIAKRYGVDSIKLNRDYNTLSVLSEDIKPEPNDILSYLIFMSLNEQQLSYGSLGIQMKNFLERLYFSEGFFSALGVSAYDNHGNELHVMEIVDSLFEIENRFENIPTTVWEAHLHRADLLSSFRSGMVGAFGESGYKIYSLLGKNSLEIDNYRDSINNLIEIYEKELKNQNKTFIFVSVSFDDIGKSYAKYHKETTRLHGKVTFKELTRYNGEYCLVYQKEMN